MAHVSRNLLAVVAFLLAFASPQILAQSRLLTPVAQDSFAPVPLDLAVTRSRWVIPSEAVLIAAADSLRANPASAPILQANLFDDADLAVRLTSIETHADGTLVLQGPIDALHFGWATLVYRDGILAANFSGGGSTYQVRFRGAGGHEAREIDQRVYRDHGEPPVIPVPDNKRYEPDAPATTAADTGAVVDVMVLYTPSALAAVSGLANMNTLIALGVTETNQAYANSGVIQRIRLVHSAQSPTAFPDTLISGTLSSLRNDAAVLALRNTYGADVVSLWLNDPSSCGLGYVMLNTTGFAPNAYNLVHWNCATGYYSFAHEMGHNMGLAHDPGGGGDGLYAYSHGYVFPSGLYRTILAYGSAQRIQYFSSPLISYLGVPSGNAASADNARTLNETRTYSANWRTSTAAGGWINFNSASYTVSETAGTQTLVVNRTSGSGNPAASVQYTTVNGTAVAGTAYTTTSGTLNWAAGDTTSRNIVVPILNDPAQTNKAFTVVLSNATGAPLGDTPSATVNITNVAPTDVFPVGCTMPAGWTVPAGATAGWSVATDSFSEGACSLKSNPIGDSGGAGLRTKAQVEVTRHFSAGNVTFFLHTESEASNDCLSFFIDGVAQSLPSNCGSGSFIGVGGNIAWTSTLAIPITAGLHTLRWSFERNNTLGFGANAAWIDNVVLPAVPANYLLTVTKAGTGTGTVTGIGITCGGDCTESLSPGANVDFSAAADAGSTFAGWSGACTGTGTCSVTMNAATTVTATFNSTAPVAAKRFDLSGDGNADVLLRGPNGEVVSWLMNGTAITNATLLLGTTTYQATHVTDLDGNSRADVLLKGPTGDLVAWLMNGSAISSSMLMLGGGTGYSVDKVGDFNGDGRADILLRHTDGTLVIWLMNGTSVSSSATVLGAGTGFSPTLVGDLNGDGRDDIVLSHSDGRVTIWLMNGTAISSSAGVLGAGTGYVMTHAADVNGDGRKDLLLRGSADELVLWIMNGTTITSSHLLIGAGTGYRVSHTGDFNNDTRADLLLRHTNGSIVMWLMNGSTLISSTLLVGATTYNATHALDFNNDGRTDVLLRGPNGEVVQWQMNGATIQSSALLLGTTTFNALPTP